MHKTIKKTIVGFTGLFLLLLGVGIGVSLVNKNQDIREKAAPATTAYISPTQQDAQVGKDLSFFVKLDSGDNQIIGVDVRLTFDPNVFQITSLEKGNAASPFDQTIFSTYDNTAGTIKYAIYTTDKTKAVKGDGLDILRVNAKSKSNANLATYNISFAAETAASALSETQNVITTMTPGSITLVASDAQTTTNTTVGEPNSCGGTCGSNYNCAANYFCYQGFCRNPVCKEDSDCDCKVAATAAPTTKPKTTTATAAPKKGQITTTTAKSNTPTPVATSGSSLQGKLNLTNIDTSIPEVDLQREEQATKSGLAKLDLKLIGLIAGIFLGLVLLYMGIRSLKKDKTNPPKIDLDEPQSFNDTTSGGFPSSPTV